ncbi:hypothetical protein E1281_18410 [Actinomadura sp. KC345]|uniref:hypothetical protein n=1 Tax=Actinomadura sp. KC345 TaxID=2530371 RepID=UPI00104AEDE6|nr:hypothetical protein [Actinomadura sp. KC345]TDC52861.1 hypothetical protein E1281_18410 [Actinomadura sp. KC345]
MRPRPCRRCGAPVLTVHERDVRVALTGVIDADPLSVFAPLDPGPIWEKNPRLGWMSLDIPRRRGNPLHRSHQCTTDVCQNERSSQ